MKPYEIQNNREGFGLPSNVCVINMNRKQKRRTPHDPTAVYTQAGKTVVLLPSNFHSVILGINV